MEFEGYFKYGTLQDFQSLQDFKEKNGHCDVRVRPKQHPTGSLGRWVEKQRHRYNSRVDGKRLEEKLDNSKDFASKSASPSSDSASIENDNLSLESRGPKGVSSQGENRGSGRSRTFSSGSNKNSTSVENPATNTSNRSKRTSFGVAGKPAAVERKSRLQNPSSRDKRLSTIPSDRPSIMPPAEAEVVKAQKDAEDAAEANAQEETAAAVAAEVAASVEATVEARY